MREALKQSISLMREAISLMREALKQSSEAIGGNRRGPQRAPHGGHVTRGCELGVARLGLEEERLATVLAVGQVEQEAVRCAHPPFDLPRQVRMGIHSTLGY